MAQIVRDIMTPDPVLLDASATLREAAQQMRDRDIGDVLVRDGSSLRGILTDRDIVLRCVAENREPDEVTVGSVCTGEVVTLSPDAEVGEAIRLMTDKAVRRIPVVEGDRPVGIVSLGDLAVERDRESALGQISAAEPRN